MVSARCHEIPNLRPSAWGKVFAAVDGARIRVRGKGLDGEHGGPAGDLWVVVQVLPSERFARRGKDVVIDVPVTFPEAALGAEIDVPTPLGERVRDEGGHARVGLDDITPLLAAWERLVLALAELGQGRVREGLVKDIEGRDVAVAPPESEEELVEYEGMLISGSAAQRRG